MAIYDNPLTAGFGSQLPYKRKASDSPEPTGTWPGGKRRKKKEKSTRRLYGFDSNQLQAIDAVPALIKGETPLLKLGNPIHPILALQNWRTRE